MATNNAAQYLTRVLGAITSGKIAELKEKQLKRIAAIVTGLQILSNPKYHSILKLAPGDVEKIKSSLTTKSTADRVVAIGSRSPTMLSQNEQNLVHFKTRSQQTKATLAQQIKQLATTLDSSPPPTTGKPALPTPQPNLSKPPV